MRLQNPVEHAFLADLLASEAARIVQHRAVAVAEDVRRIPAAHAEHAGFEPRRDDGLEQRLPGFEVFAGNGYLMLVRELEQCGRVDAEIGRGIREWNAFRDRGIGVKHARGHMLVTIERFLQRGDTLVRLRAVAEALGAAAPEHDATIDA